MDVIYGSAVSGPVNASALHAALVACLVRGDTGFNPLAQACSHAHKLAIARALALALRSSHVSSV